MATAARRKKGPFPFVVGMKPHRVTVVARAAKGGFVYLRWTVPGTTPSRRAWQSLGMSVEGKSAAELTEMAREAHDAALRKYEELTGKRQGALAAPSEPVRLSGAWALLTDPATGRYAKDSRYRRQLDHALTAAARVFGQDFLLLSFDNMSLRRLVRWRAEQAMARKNKKGVAAVGMRPAEIVGTRMITILSTLKAEGHLPKDYVLPGGKEWKGELRTYIEQARGREIPAPHRPRYSDEEIAKLYAVRHAVDPRFALMMDLGLELRPEQVGRVRRSNFLDAPLGLVLRVEGRGKKRGVPILLGPSLMEALQTAWDPTSPLGYLATQEALWRKDQIDYPLFPSVIMRAARKGRRGAAEKTRRAIAGHDETVSRTQVGEWMRTCEDLAGVAHVDGRGWYGMRRQRADEEADEETGSAAVQNMFGWTTGRMGEEVYQDRDRRRALVEARDRREAQRRRMQAPRDGDDGVERDASDRAEMDGDGQRGGAPRYPHGTPDDKRARRTDDRTARENPTTSHTSTT